MSIYADTSFFVSLYVADRHSPEAERRLALKVPLAPQQTRRLSGTPRLWLTPLHVAEWTHAIEQHVFRKAISRREADRLEQRFQQHRASGLWIEVALPEKALELCTQLAIRHGAKLGVRTLDTLHVASALQLKAERFWTFDERQEKLARAEGLKAT